MTGAFVVTPDMARAALDPDSRDRLVPIADLVEDTAIPARTWKMLRALGVGPAFFVIGGRTMYRLVDVDEWSNDLRAKARRREDSARRGQRHLPVHQTHLGHLRMLTFRVDWTLSCYTTEMNGQK